MTTQIASAPLNKPGLDLVLRSSDHVNFFVRKAIIAEASSVFADMFAVAQAEPTLGLDNMIRAVDVDLPVIELTEPSPALDYLLRFIYPVANPNVFKLQDALAVLDAARRYVIGFVGAGVVGTLERLAEQQSLRAYALACSRCKP